MIGQEKIISLLNNFTVSTLPQSILFIGEPGSGKHTLAKDLANRLKIDTIELTEKIEAENLIEYKQAAVNRIYLIDLAIVSKKQQNLFLKFIEEPSPYMHIILLANSEMQVLETILNRCIKYKLEPYTKDQLKQIVNTLDELAYEICKTPGQLLGANLKTLPSLLTLCQTIVDKYTKASYANAMTIATKINWKEDYDKYDLNLFLNTLSYTAFKDYLDTNSEISFKIYFEVNKYIALENQLDKKPLIEKFIYNFLTNLWELLH